MALAHVVEPIAELLGGEAGLLHEHCFLCLVGVAASQVEGISHGARHVHEAHGFCWLARNHTLRTSVDDLGSPLAGGASSYERRIISSASDSDITLPNDLTYMELRTYIRSQPILTKRKIQTNALNGAQLAGRRCDEEAQRAVIAL